jgi:hypothetical protein
MGSGFTLYVVVCDFLSLTKIFGVLIAIYYFGAIQRREATASFRIGWTVHGLIVARQEGEFIGVFHFRPFQRDFLV